MKKELISMNTQNNNCLALSIRKEYRLTVVRNAAVKMIKISSKILLSILALNIINLIV